MRIAKFILLAAAGLGSFIEPVRATDPEPGSTALANTPALQAVDACERSSTCYNGFTFGAGAYLMRASFDNNLAFGVQGTTGRSQGPIPPGSPGTRTAQRIEIDHNVVASPEIWAGWMSESGWGVRVRYWYFSDGTSQAINGSNQGVNSTLLFSAAPLGLGLINGTSVMEATSQLRLQVWDVEGQYNFHAAGWNILLSGGVRVAEIDQRYNAYSPAPGSSSLLSTNNFSGVGPTMAMMLRHPLGYAWLNAYGSARYSFVFGNGHQEASIPDQNVAAQDERHVGMGIGELELGLEANRVVGRSRLFGQVGVIAQNWSGAGSASRSSVNVLPGGGFNGASYSGASDINFLGLALRLGVTY